MASGTASRGGRMPTGRGQDGKESPPRRPNLTPRLQSLPEGEGKPGHAPKGRAEL